MHVETVKIMKLNFQQVCEYLEAYTESGLLEDEFSQNILFQISAQIFSQPWLLYILTYNVQREKAPLHIAPSAVISYLNAAS